MRLFAFNLLALMGLTCTLAFAQEGTLRGVVKDKETKEPLIGANVYASEKGESTDADGFYEIKIKAGEPITVEFSYTGYETVKMEVQVNKGETKTMDVVMGMIENILETTTITGSKFEKPLGEVTVSLDVLRPGLIESYAAPSIDKVMDKLPGVDIVDGQVNIRSGAGFSGNTGSRVLMMIDDIPALQPDFGLAQWADVPVELVERTEVLKGAASALYGSSALNGIINIRTIYPTATPVTKFAVWGTGYAKPRDFVFDTCDACVPQVYNNDIGYMPWEGGAYFAHARRVKRFGFVVGGYYMQNKGFVKDTYKKQLRFDLKTQYNFTEKLTGGINFIVNTGDQASFFFWKNAINAQFEGDPNSTTYIQGKDLRFSIDPFLTLYDGAGNRHRLNARIYRSDNNQINGRSNNSWLYYAEYQFQREYKGIGIQAGVVNSYTMAGGEILKNKTATQYNFAPYLQLEGKLFDRLTLSLGARYEYNRQVGLDSVPWYDTINGIEVHRANPRQIVQEGRPVFRVGANYKLGKGTFLRGSWGTGYRFPTLSEKYLNTVAAPVVIYPNVDLTSEYGWSAEIGIKQGMKVGTWSGFLDLAGFINEYDDMIEVIGVGDASILFQQNMFNVGDTRIIGAEASIMGEGKLYGMPFTLMTGYTWTLPKYRNYGPDQRAIGTSGDENVLKYRFEHSFKFDGELTPFKGFAFGATAVYRSRIRSIDQFFRFSPDLTYQYWQYYNSDSWVIDARVSYRVNDMFKISAIGKNIANNLYLLRPARPEAPANITVRVDVTL